MDLERRQRSDIDTVTDNRLTQDLDSLPLNWEDYSITPKKHEGNNWLVIDNEYVKYSIAENDTLAFVFNPVTDLSQKDITEMTVSFDYDVSKAIVLDNISLSHDDMSEHENVNIEINGTGHVDASCNTFGLSSDVLNSIISGQAFNIGLNLIGDKSNASVRLSNVEVGFKFNNKLLDESNSVVNRLVPQVDFYREGSKLILQIGDGTGKGHVDGQYVDTYTKEEIDAKLLGKVDAVIGKGLSTNDYTGAEKNKLSGIENGANYYVHPASHGTTMIVEPSALSNIGTSGNASQYDINNAIDGALGNKANTSDLGAVALSNDYDDLDNLPTIPTVPVNVSAFNNDAGYLTQHQSLVNYIQKSGTAGLVKNDGTVDTTQYLSSLPVHNHDDRYYTESEMDTALNSKQDSLISGTNIKTINNTSLLGTGNINIQGGGSITVDSTWITGSTNPAESQLIQSALEDKTDVGHTHNDTEINSSYTNIEMGTLILATLDDVIAYNEPFTRINRALEHLLDNWEDYD